MMTFYNIHITCLAFLFLFPLFVCGQVTEKKMEDGNSEVTDKTKTLFENLVPPDRNTQRRFDQAKRLIEADRLPEAAQLLGAVLESSADFFLAPSSGVSERTSVQTFSGIVLQTLQGLPGKARESYLAQYEAQADRLLDNAVQSGSSEEIQLIAKRYTPTKAGRTALFLQGMNQFETGTYKPALLTLQKLNSSKGDLTSFEPVLSLSIASCQLRFGQKAEALQTAEELFRRQPKPEILLYGKELWKPEKPQDVVDRLSQMLEQTPKISSSFWLEQNGWKLPFGTPDQNPETGATNPLLEFVWAVPMFARSLLNKEAQPVADTVQRGKEVLLPTGQPILADGKLIFRGMKDAPEITAVDVKTGKRLWTAVEPDAALPLSQHLPMLQNRGMRMSQSSGQNQFFLRLLLWHNPLSGQFSSSGQQLYSIEGHDLQSMTFFNQIRGNQRIQIGNKAFDDPRFGPGNTLAARDINTGRILWQAGKFPYVQKRLSAYLRELEDTRLNNKNKVLPALPLVKPGQPQEPHQAQQRTEEKSKEETFSEEEKFLSETWFLGVPLPLYGRLYVIGENSGVLRLIVLDAATGRFLRQQPLAAPPSLFESDFPRKLYALTPSESNGILICPTGIGMIFALDATTAAPLWSFSYQDFPPKDSEARNNQLLQRRQNPLMFGGGNGGTLDLFSQTRWQLPSVMIDGNRVVVAPADDPALYCLELSTGELLWQKKEEKNNNPSFTVPQKKPLYAACIYNGTVYLVMHDSVLALALDSGEEKKLPFPAFPFKPSGRGVRSGHQYFLPFSGGVLGVLDLDTGTLDYLSAKPGETPPASGGAKSSGSAKLDSKSELGNLVGIQERFFSQSPLQITCLDQLEPLKKRTDALLQANPNDAEGLYQLGRIKRSEGDFTAAVDLFRRSMQTKRTELSADALRKTLLEAIRNDYPAWKQFGAELESLAEFPEEVGEILYVLARGAVHTGNLDEALDKIQKTFSLERDGTIQVPVNEKLSARLHTALGIVLQESLKTNSGGSWNTRLDSAAEALLADKKRMLPAENPVSFSLNGQEQDAVQIPPEIQSLRIFSTLFHALPVSKKVDALLLPELEKHRLAAAAESLIQNKEEPAAAEKTKMLAELLAAQGNIPDALYYKEQLAQIGTEEDKKIYRAFTERPNVKKYFARYYAPVSYPGGVVRVEDEAAPDFLTNPQDARSGAIARILKETGRGNTQFPMNRQNLSFLGSYEPFLSPLTFTLESYHPDVYLVCSDSFGKELWRSQISSVLTDMGEFAMSNDYYNFSRNGFLDQTVYLKGCNHLLIFVRHNVLVAFDTSQYDAENGPKILWKRVLTAPIPARQTYSAVMSNQLIGIIQGSQQQDKGFPREPLFVSPNVVCYRDTDKIYGLDPLTGQTMWVRTPDSPSCSILGDRDHLFLVFPDIQSVTAVDPFSGNELVSGAIPAGGVFTFGTDIIFIRQVRQVPGTENVFPFRLYVCDLKELYQKRRRALLVSDGSEEGESPLPSKPVCNLSYETLLRQVHHGRFLCSASWVSKTVQMFDLQDKKDVWENNGVKLPDMVLGGNSPRWDSDIDVELFGEKFLVTFVEKGQVETQVEEVIEDGIKIRRRRNVVNGIPCRSAGFASMMLYGADGKAEWEQPARIENWYRLLCVPSQTPVVLFSVMFNDEDMQHAVVPSTAMLGIDKQTGKNRFRKIIPIVQRNHQQTLLQGFRVEVDPDEKIISFIAPNRKVNAVFTDAPPQR